MTSSLKLNVIRIDGGTQSRASLNDAVVEDYAQTIRDGTDFPPVVVFHDGKKYWLADGFHRVEAYRAAGAVEIAADIRQGDRRDAILYSVGANADHGLRRTKDDKRRAVMTLLNDAEWSQWSDREIARQCGVGRDLVGDVRRSLSAGDSEPRIYTTKHGTMATMDTAKIGKSHVEPEQQAEFDRQRQEAESRLSPEVQEHRARTEDYRKQAETAKAQPSRNVEALRAEVEEKDEYIASLESEIADLNRRLTKFDDMVAEYERGGFEEVIKGRDEQIRVLRRQVERESQEKVKNLRSADYWKKKAIEFGANDDVVIDVATGEVSRG